MNERADALRQHYGQTELARSIIDAVDAAFPRGAVPTPRDLASLDQFHARGIEATIELGRACKVEPHTTVLDIGSGLGGPSRYLAATYGCTVLGLDLSPAFVEVAQVLAERMGLADRVRYAVADAAQLALGEAQFDLVWMQHVAMNIADRTALYAAVRRVLRPRGRYATYDIVAGADALHFPVPWSRDPRTSFLLTEAQTREALAESGFQEVLWRNQTREVLDWFDARRARPTGPAQGQGQGHGQGQRLGLSLAMGPDFALMSANLERNLREGRAAVVMAVLEVC